MRVWTRRPIGLEVAATAVRGVVLAHVPARRGTPKIARFAEHPLPDGAVDAGQVLEPAIVADAVDAVIGDLRSRGPVAVAAAGTHSALRTVAVPAALEPAEQHGYLRRNAVRIGPRVTSADAAMSLAPLTRPTAGNADQHLLVAATTPDVITTLTGTVRRRTVAIVDLDVVALARAYNATSWAGETVLVDVGHSSTTIGGFTDGILRWAETAPTGGRDFTNAAAAAGLDHSDADRLKRQPAHQRPGPISRHIEVAADDLADVAATTIEARQQLTGNRRVVLVGGAAQLAELPGRFARRLHATVEVPPPSLELPSGPADSHAYAVAAGMALSPLIAP